MISRWRFVAALFLAALAAAPISVGQSIIGSTRQVVDGQAPFVEDLGIQGPVALRDRPSASASTPEYVPDRVIVKFRSETPRLVRSRVAQSMRATLETSPPSANFDVLVLQASEDPMTIAQDLTRHPDVEYAQPAFIRHALDVPNDPLFDSQWNLNLLRMPRAWDINRGASSSIVVAVLDTGVALHSGTLQYTANAFRVGNASYRALGRINVPFAAAPDLDAPGRFVEPWGFRVERPSSGRHGWAWDSCSGNDCPEHGKSYGRGWDGVQCAANAS
jgi:hypothetical protein